MQPDPSQVDMALRMLAMRHRCERLLWIVFLAGLWSFIGWGLALVQTLRLKGVL